MLNIYYFKSPFSIRYKLLIKSRQGNTKRDSYYKDLFRTKIKFKFSQIFNTDTIFLTI